MFAVQPTASFHLDPSQHSYRADAIGTCHPTRDAGSPVRRRGRLRWWRGLDVPKRRPQRQWHHGPIARTCTRSSTDTVARACTNARALIVANTRSRARADARTGSGSDAYAYA